MRVALALGLALLSSLAAPSAQPPSLTLNKCTVAGSAARCGALIVPEDRTRPNGRTISLRLTILDGSGDRQPDPVLFLAGGPGQGAAAVVDSIAGDLRAVAPDRDIILVDQRGTGRSNPLTCEGGFTVLEPGRVEELRRCRRALDARADVNQYGTTESVDDLAAVVRALGHAQVNVVAASYGTRLALHFMQRHPSLVRASVLRAIAPHGFNVLFDGSRYARAALDRVVSDCAADAACAAAFPDLARDLRVIREQLRKAPVVAKAGTDAAAADVRITADLFERVMYALMLSTQTRQMMPLVIHSAAAGSWQPLAGVAAAIEALYNSVSLGAYLSVICREDAPRLTSDERRELLTAFGAATGSVVQACDAWPVRADPRAPGTASDVPTLVVSGQLDPAMPAEVGEGALRQLPRGTHLVLPATAHGPMFPGCAAALVHSFLRTPGTASLDTSCLKTLSLPPFRVPPGK